jgi:hypothetical protein
VGEGGTTCYSAAEFYIENYANFYGLAKHYSRKIFFLVCMGPNAAFSILAMSLPFLKRKSHKILYIENYAYFYGLA